jgi:hypothetical protein
MPKGVYQSARRTAHCRRIALKGGQAKKRAAREKRIAAVRQMTDRYEIYRYAYDKGYRAGASVAERRGYSKGYEAGYEQAMQELASVTYQQRRTA